MSQIKNTTQSLKLSGAYSFSGIASIKFGLLFFKVFFSMIVQMQQL
jgi:hypothetical protein